MEFPSTRWTLILASRDKPELQRRALAELLQTYWLPLYCFLRRKGLTREAAEDAVQAFAVRLLERDALSKLDPARGRLRAFLKVALTNQLATSHERDAAQKRGGGVKLVALDAEEGERAVAAEGGDPELAYQRAWAGQLMARALERLRAEFQDGQRRGPFELVEGYFRGNEPASYAQLAERHHMSQVQVKAFLHRARQRYRELVRSEVADTVDSEGEIDAELGELVRAL